MLTLINTNRMVPAIAPLGVEYVAGAARQAGIEVDVLDLCLADEPDAAMAQHFADRRAELVGISFRNVDDCFWPSGEWFVPGLARTIESVRALTGAPIVLGGVGFSIFAEQIVAHTGADFGIRGDGEGGVVSLLGELRGRRRFDRVAGLVWRDDGRVRANPPAWPDELSLPTARDAIDNAAYFRLGGQGGFETKRGCNGRCIYCADPIAKGTAARLRAPAEVADEVESLLAPGVGVLHTGDSEVNGPAAHARAVCDEFIRRSFDGRVRWYTYLSVVPFDADLARAMRRAGCVGINFTGDSASAAMLAAYGQAHRAGDLASAVKLCRDNGIAVMIDLLLGGPGETPETVAETVSFVKRVAPDCAGAPLGIRVYPGTEMAAIVAAEGPLESNRNLHRKYDGPVDFFHPTFYVSRALGERPADLVRDLIGGDERFFPPPPDEAAYRAGGESGDHNYNENTDLVEAIAAGARGAYWHILRDLRNRPAGRGV